MGSGQLSIQYTYIHIYSVVTTAISACEVCIGKVKSVYEPSGPSGQAYQAWPI